ncbi:hypothetical protein GZ77_00365 [Endozoicomonas montiporae]|uniref:Protein Syd n=2 Tax=Endozoicomonas montiporae TaxID=1027273 RepID=A0A081N9R7_9GAMM|nr:SecY-interacting protein [Endozoicomonas montiporae]AMO55046.1 SecY interacting protein Syd [Endozoicomonas montiporae CL-33]KEQ15190.1 hypothetical protein GZ77_00365 [Endozoicomonas montiporae]
MSINHSSLINALEHFYQRYIQSYHQQHNQGPTVEHDEDWPSPCEQSKGADGERIYWQPVACEPPLDFTNIEQALELELHPDIKTYFGSFFSANLAATASDGGLELLFPWSQKDFERLQENILGHIWMKRKLKQEETVFFAVTDIDDVILSLVNSTGEIWAEKVGKKPHRKIADSMTDFINSLEPVV